MAFEISPMCELVGAQDRLALVLAGGRRLVIRHEWSADEFIGFWRSMGGAVTPSLQNHAFNHHVSESLRQSLFSALQRAHLIVANNRSGELTNQGPDLWETLLQPLFLNSEKAQLSRHVSKKKISIHILTGAPKIWNSVFEESNLDVSISRFATADKNQNSCDLTLAVGERTSPKIWSDFNEVQINVNQSAYLPIVLDPFGFSIGPILGQDDGPCWMCLNLRRRAHVPRSEEHEGFARALIERQNGSSHPFIEQLAAQLAKIQTGLILSGCSPVPLQKNLIECDVFNLKMQSHPILPTPKCPFCSKKDARPLRAVRVQLAEE